MEPIDAISGEIGETAERIVSPTVPMVAITLTIVVAVILHRAIYRRLKRRAEREPSGTLDLLLRLRRPARPALILIGLILVIPAIQLGATWSSIAERLVLILLIALVGATALSLVNLVTDRRMRRHDVGAEENFEGRRIVTQLRVVKATARIVIVLLTAGAILMTFENVREYGVSILAAGGAAGLVLGFAARPVLTNLIAGIQIALTQPIKIEDAVIVEGEWGWIEEITSTYVVIRIWDWRRLIVPLSHFIEKPFQNWTREANSIIGVVTWHVDYTVPMDALRAAICRTIEEHDLWDGQVANVQVTEAGPQTLTVRGLMSARTSPRAWDLRCAVREGVVGWLQAEHPEALPRNRSEIIEAGGRARDAAAAGVADGADRGGVADFSE